MFKKSVLMLLCGANLSLRAQQTVVIPPFREAADQLLRGISQYPVPSGILYSKSFPFSGLAEENVRQLPEWNPGRFVQAVHELERASLTPPENPQGLKLSEKYRKQSLAGELQLLAFSTMVQELDTGRIKDTTLILENKVFRFNPKIGRDSPFSAQEMSAAVLMADPNPAIGLNYRIHFPQNIPLGNQFRLPLAARIRFGEGSWEVLTPSAVLLKNFSSAGPLKMELEITWTGNLVRTYMQTLEIQSNNACQDPDFFRRPDDCPEWHSNPEFAPSAPPVAIQAQIPFEGISGKGEVYYYLRNGNQYSSTQLSLRNPILFVDGIDFGDARKGEVIYGKYLSYLPSQAGTSSSKLGEQLRSQGYDVIILNFPDGRIPANSSAGKANEGIDGGCDFIERNAMVLVRLIQQVNQQLEPGSKKITLVGPSMGGLIARYALAYMEKNASLTGPHRCGLFLAQDSPFLGANIPVGLQQMIENLADFNVSKAEQALELLRSPASCELLINHFQHSPGFTHHADRTTFLQNCLLNSLPNSRGWPVDPEMRMVAIANGAGNGTLVNGKDQVSPISGGGDMLSFNLRMRDPLTLGLALAFYDGGISLVTALILRTGKIEWKSRYVPGNNGMAETFRFRFDFSMFGGSLVLASDSRTWAALNSGVSLDAAPGGFSNSTDAIAAGVRDGVNSAASLFVRTKIDFADSYHSFVPLKSALAFRWNQSSFGDLKEAIHLRNLVCTGETPFHAYYCPEVNEEHVRLNAGAVGFIFSQLNYQPPAAGVYYPAEIVGPRAQAAGSAEAFSSVYSGNLQFRASWHISESTGVTASISNYSASSCQVTAGPVTANGFYILNLTTEVKTLNGEWVCAGMNRQKVFVRQTGFMGIVDVPCTTNLPIGCSFYVTSDTPDYSQLTNGVTGDGFEWQISRYTNSDFGNYCWNNALTIIPSFTPTFYGSQKAYINLLHTQTYGMGNVFTYYVRVRNKLKMPNPDFGQPGEPAFLTFYGAWKMRQLQTQILPGSDCPYCPGFIVVNPENPVKNIHSAISLTIPEGINISGRMQVFDAHNISVFECIANSRNFNIPIDLLDPGIFRVVYQSDAGDLIREFVLRTDQDSRLSVAPALVKKEFDLAVNLRITDGSFLESGDGSYHAVLQNQTNGVNNKWTGFLPHFELSSYSLTEGEYLLTLDNGLEQISCTFQVKPEDPNPIKIFPNPANSYIQVRIPDFNLQPDAEIRILNHYGYKKISQPLSEDFLTIKTTGLHPGPYILQLRNGGELKNVWFSIQ
jgi:hypothetical protein